MTGPAVMEDNAPCAIHILEDIRCDKSSIARSQLLDACDSSHSATDSAMHVGGSNLLHVWRVEDLPPRSHHIFMPKERRVAWVCTRDALVIEP
eukprot:CAMPEP_0119333970 /NCGR_PEP_ID=MMETSP1333-20130426/86367_1 /TAXON_ID=418940 /ORGANISM="Scyphosphaera apsteinii, Strain RCC1455" /LENGTH=92 /DNA_ID=CAMNT_0007344167 /DNA_START=197 /DNA_END=474 /DNA_ORIENTATION=+